MMITGKSLLHSAKPILKTLPGQSWHPQIDNDATVFSHAARLEKLIGRGIRVNLIRRDPQEPRDALPDGRIIVDEVHLGRRFHDAAGCFRGSMNEKQQPCGTLLSTEMVPP